jgi:putative DNA methylase
MSKEKGSALPPKSLTIEKFFPVREVSAKSMREKDRAPPIFEMLFWWTRKPLIACRAAIAGAVSDLDDSEEFKKAIALDKERPYEENPRIRAEGVKLLDPFAGGGSIPFEALRMGMDVTAIELLPVAYVVLKATLEYPLKYGEKLVEDVERWGREMIRRLEEKVGHLYHRGDLVYIGTWFVKCPKCGFWTPLVKDWWLDRKRGIWMRPVIEGGKFKVEIEGEGKASNGTISRGTGTCINCNSTIMESYIKGSIKKYLNGDKSFAEPLLLVKVIRVGDRREYKPAYEEDLKLLRGAETGIRILMSNYEFDVPSEPIASYENRSLWVLAYGFDKFHQFFNPRQLLTMTTLIKLIRRISKEIEEEKKKEGLSHETAREYAGAVATYLALMAVEFSRFNSLITHWDSTNVKIGHSLAFRGGAMTWNFCEVNPFMEISGSLINMFKKVVRALKFATNKLSTKVPLNVQDKDKKLDLNEKAQVLKVLLASATDIPLPSDEKYDLIVTDPPYYHDVPYAELSDFYYIWLKRALSEYYPEAFHYNTQWEELALQEVSVNPARFNIVNARQRAMEHYRALLKKSMKECYRLLKDEGLLVVFFAHSSVEAWRDLVEALQSAGFEITRTWPVHTEKRGRATAFGKGVIDTSLIVVAKKKVQSGGVGYVEELVPEVRVAVRNEVKRLVQEFNLKGADLINAAMGPALKIITRYDRIERASISGAVENVLNIVQETVVPAFLEVKLGSQVMARLDPYTSFYMFTRMSYGLHGKEKRLVLPFDHANRVALALGVNIDNLEKAHVVKHTYTKRKERKAVEVILPRGEVKTFLKERGLNLDEPAPKSIIDVVHLLEVAYNLKGRRGVNELYTKLNGFRGFDLEAIKTVIQALYMGLADDDPEKPLLKPLLDLDLRETKHVTLDKLFGW